MSGRVNHLGLEVADLEAFPVLEQVIELRAVAGDVGGVEYRAKNALHVANVLADADLRAGLELDVGRPRQVVGVRVRLQHPSDRDSGLGGGGQDRLGRMDRCPAAAVVEVEHGIDDGTVPAALIPDQVAHGVGGLVEESPNGRLDGRVHALLPRFEGQALTIY